MTSSTTIPTTTMDKVEMMKTLLSLVSSIDDAKRVSPSSSDGVSLDAVHNKISTIVQSLHNQLFDGPNGVIQFLLAHVVFQRGNNDSYQEQNNYESALRGDNALSLLSYLVESYPEEYIVLTASSVRRMFEQIFTIVPQSTNNSSGSEDPNNNNNNNHKWPLNDISDALILSLAKLLIGTNSDNQVGIATDIHETLLLLCRWGATQNSTDHNYNISERVLQTLYTLWTHLQQSHDRNQRRLYSTSQIRMATLLIDICLMGGAEMSMALAKRKGDCIMDKLLQIALNYPNDDPLLQVSALDQLERLTTLERMTPARAEFLMSHQVLRRGLLRLVGSPESLLLDIKTHAESSWEDIDPINGDAAFRLLTEICRVGILSYPSIITSESVWTEFVVLLSNFQKALHNFDPQGEIERLSYIHAVSSLIGSCAILASSSMSTTSPNATLVTSAILNDTVLIHEWLSLHSRVSQPKLKSTVLYSLSQVIEPSIGEGYSNISNVKRPSDSIMLQLYHEFSHANQNSDTTELLLASAKSPFVEERLGAYDMMRALVMRGAGVRLLLIYDDGLGNDGSGEGSFLKWLLNHDSECTIEGRKARYQIVHSMLSYNGDILAGLLPPRALRQLEEWDRSGPSFLITVPWDMAIE